jgi:hypothetical protein
VPKAREELEDDPKAAFCTEVALLVHRADELGLHKTARKLDEALFQCGFEVADHLAAGKMMALKEEGKDGQG